MRKTIAVLAGDGIGPEVMKAALSVLDAVARRFNHTFQYRDALIGGAAFEEYGIHFPDETRRVCEEADAILFGSVGGPINEAHLPKWKGCEVNSILALRKHFSFFANLRPVRIYKGLLDVSPLKPTSKLAEVDILFVRELIGDIYFGEKKRFEVNGKRAASDIAVYDENQIASIARIAFDAAAQRKGRVVSVDKANVLETSKLWREIVTEVHRDFPKVQLEHMLVDNCAMQLVRAPQDFDVVLTPNLFGDILSDLGAALPGSLGLTPSASLNTAGFGLYEPSGGSAPDIAGKGIANPTAQILSAASMLRHSFGLYAESLAIEASVEQTFDSGIRTADLSCEKAEAVGTESFGREIASRV